MSHARHTLPGPRSTARVTRVSDQGVERDQGIGTPRAQEEDMNNTNRLMLLGAVRAARAALTSHTGFTHSEANGEFADRVAALDEELRKLARDIARKEGV